MHDNVEAFGIKLLVIISLLGEEKMEVTHNEGMETTLQSHQEKQASEYENYEIILRLNTVCRGYCNDTRAFKLI